MAGKRTLGNIFIRDMEEVNPPGGGGRGGQQKKRMKKLNGEGVHYVILEMKLVS